MNKTSAISILAGTCLMLFSARAVQAKSPAAVVERPEAMAETPLAELPAPPSTPSAAMEEKFRKLQKEMAREKKANPADEGVPENTPPKSVGVGGLTIQILFGLVFVLLLAVVSIRGLKHLQGRMLARPGKNGDILEVLESCHLGSNQRIVALRMNDEVGVIGVTQHGISLLTVLKEPIDELRRSRAAAGEGNSAAFSDNLNKLLERFKKPKKVSDLLDEGRV